jgi:hypothetical protein
MVSMHTHDVVQKQNLLSFCLLFFLLPRLSIIVVYIQRRKRIENLIFHQHTSIAHVRYSYNVKKKVLRLRSHRLHCQKPFFLYLNS